MNASVYLFGEFNSGYTQYPDDYTSEILGKFHMNSKSTTQLTIHRDGNLMYYGYIRILENNHYIGLCVVINSLILTRIDGLFSLFENTITGLVRKGHLIHFNEQGDIVTSIEKLYLNREEIDLITESLRAGFNRFDNCTQSLPPISYGTSKDSVRNFVVEDDLNDIIKSSYTTGYTFVYKSKGFNTAQLNSYKGILARSNQEKKDLLDKLTQLQTEHAKTLRQKKQFKVVLILVVVLFCCAISLFSLNDNLNITRNALSIANDTIGIQKDSLSSKNTLISKLHTENYRLDHNLSITRNALSIANNTVSMLNDSLSSQNTQISKLHTENHKLEQSRQTELSRRVKAENNLEGLKGKIRVRQPFIVKGTSFNYNSGYLSFNYYGISKGNVTVNVRAFSDNGICYTNSSSIYIYEGDNSASIFVNRNINKNKWYSFELLIGNIILGGSRH